MPNRGIYGNAGLHKSYLKTKVYVEKRAPIRKTLGGFCVMHSFIHTSATCVQHDIQL